VRRRVSQQPSAPASAAAKGWANVEVPGAFAAWFPELPRQEATEEGTSWTANGPAGIAFMISCSPGAARGMSAEEAWARIRAVTSESLDGKAVVFVREIERGTRRGIYTRFVEGGYVFENQAFVVDEDLFMVGAAAPQQSFSDDDAWRFFDGIVFPKGASCPMTC
jgi:hypothetical protein